MTGTLLLHDYWRSSSAYRVRIALNLKGVPYERAVHDLLAGEQRAEAYVALAPQGLVPAIEVDGLVLTQSIAIMEWLEEQYPEPRLLPSEAGARAIVRGMVALIVADIQPLQNLRVLKALKMRFGADQSVLDDWARHWIGEGFTALETLVARHGEGFCFGGAPSLADCMLIPQMFNADRYQLDLAAFPSLRAVRERCEALPAFVAAHPRNQPDAPS